MKFLQRKRRAAVGLYPMSLIFISLVFLVGPGMLYNNFTNSGLAVNQVLGVAGVCGNFAAGVPIDFTCQGSVAAGCQAQPSQCTLSGVTVSFFNANSPFTALASGNIFGLFGSLTSNGNANRGPFDPNGGGSYYHADCELKGVNGSPSNNITQNAFAATIHSCTQTDSNNLNVTKTDAIKFANWNYNSTVFSTTSPPTANLIPFFNVVLNATYGLLCYNQGYWYQTSQPNIGYSTIGCDYFNAAAAGPPGNSGSFNPALTPIYSFLLAVPCNTPGQNGCKSSMPSGASYHIKVLFQPENWDTAFCTDAFDQTTLDIQNWFSSQQCINMETWFTTPHTSGGFGNSGGAAAFGFFTPFLTILLGLILFLIGTGINIQAGGQIFGTGTQFGAGTNRQGTKLAQVLGLALIAYTFLYSQFSVWFTSGVLPNGFDGVTGVISIVEGAIFFGGCMWMATDG